MNLLSISKSLSPSTYSPPIFLLPSFLFSFLPWLIKSYMVKLFQGVTGFCKLQLINPYVPPLCQGAFWISKKNRPIFNSQPPSNFNLTTSNNRVDKYTIKHANLPNSSLKYQNINRKSYSFLSTLH